MWKISVKKSYRLIFRINLKFDKIACFQKSNLRSLKFAPIKQNALKLEKYLFILIRGLWPKNTFIEALS